jgi:hypothetical protein
LHLFLDEFGSRRDSTLLPALLGPILDRLDHLLWLADKRAVTGPELDRLCLAVLLTLHMADGPLLPGRQKCPVLSAVEKQRGNGVPWLEGCGGGKDSGCNRAEAR